MINVETLVNAAWSKDDGPVVDQLDKWFEAGLSDPGPLDWLASIPNLRDRQHFAGTLARISAQTGSHEVIAALSNSLDPSILAGVIAPPNERGYTTAHFAVEGCYHKVVEALASSEDQAVKPTLIQRTTHEQMTLAELAVERGRSSILEALAGAGGAALTSLSEPHPNEDVTPQERAEARGFSGVIDVLKRVTPQVPLKVPLNFPAIPQVPSPLDYQTHLRAEQPQVPPLPLDQRLQSPQTTVLPPLLPRRQPQAGGAPVDRFEAAVARSRQGLERRRQKHAASLDPQSKGKGPAGPGL